MLNKIVSGVIVVLLAGCTSLGGRSEPEPQQFVLAPQLPAPSQAAPSPRPAIAVAPPTAQPGYGTARLVYTNSAYRLDHYARNEWADTPQRMLEPLLVRALDGTGRFEVLGAGSAATLADFYLDTNVVLFRQEFGSGGSVGHVVLRVQLGKAGSGQVVATRTLEAYYPTSSADSKGGVEAINTAVGQVLGELTALVTQLAGDYRPAPPRQR